ncbi:MAG: dGTP triphosphohydrolase [Brevinema sp.]
MKHHIEWHKILSDKRDKSSQSSETQKTTDLRSQYKKDQGRVSFSNDFRRLAHKTQVFTAPTNTIVHNRLTHTLEVANIGESLAELIASDIIQDKLNGSPLHDIFPKDFIDNYNINSLSKDMVNYLFIKTLGEITRVACMLHDIGNPPFGHAGEEGIRHATEKFISSSYLKETDNHELKDIIHFEGNAFGLHLILTRPEYNLTYASIGAMIKYPITTTKWENLTKDDKKKKPLFKKNGIFDINFDKIDKIQGELGLKTSESGIYLRNPISLIMEAADDIGYSIMDLEDALKMEIITPSDNVTTSNGSIPIKHILLNILKDHNLLNDRIKEVFLDNDNSVFINKIEIIRSIVIHGLILQAKNTFIKNYDDIMNGKYVKSLLEDYDHIKSIKAFSLENIYGHRNILLLESAGFQIMESILGMMLPAGILPEQDLNKKESHALKLLKKECSTFILAQSIQDRALAVAGFVARMSDNYAIEFYQRTHGIKIQGIE